MSQLEGLFSLRTPRDLLDKLEADFQRMQPLDRTSKEAQYAAFDFFVTALHLSDWKAAQAGTSLSAQRNYPDFALVDHLGNGAKHFRTSRPSVSDTNIEGLFDPAYFDPAIFDTGRLVIDLDDGTTEDVLAVAERVLHHWRAAV